MSNGTPKLSKFLLGLCVFLFASAAYLYALPSATIIYAAIVVLHAAVGVAAAILLVPHVLRQFRRVDVASRAGYLLLLAGAALGLVLIFTGTPRPRWGWVYAHIFVSLAAGVVLVSVWLARRDCKGTVVRVLAGSALVFLGAVTLALGSHTLRKSWQNTYRIHNPPAPPDAMDGEGDGPAGPFFPSSAQTVDGKLIPGKFFMGSESCRRCHADIFNQWNASVHHFSSFNNQWYSKSIQYMQEVVGTRPSKWCGGCHDPAVLYSGLMDTPIQQILDRPEAHAGLGCVMCHSIAKVKSTMGQGDFVLEYPVLHDLATSKNPVVQKLHDFLTNLNPEPHRRVFLKPFLRTQTAEFCSSCHKVHLDTAVNHYRWIRGFNEYDNWQASGVSGQGARSFYYPEKPQKCADCHMPLVKSNDAGNINGYVHSHAFPGANTAVPTANQDAAQLKLQEDFLKSGIVSVDIFALTEPRPQTEGGHAIPTELATTFAVGEEAESAAGVRGGPGEGEQVRPFTAPLNRVNATVRRGDDVQVDVVVRTRKVGHFFPGGTVDAFDTWLELKASDDKGQVLFWSGKVEDDGKGPVEKGAHFYRSLLVDANGNPINKRNAWSARSVVYVRLIPPGAADTVHYRLRIPENAGNQIKLRARLCYRKFSWYNTQFSFAGVPDPARGGEYTPHFDDRKFVFTGDTSRVAGKLKQIPDLPIVPVAENEVTLDVAARGAKLPERRIVLQKDDWTRWNDWGIGLLLQGDLKGARAAFEKITEMDAANPDGWVNLGRVAVQEGDMQRAREVLERALKIAPDLARANFFYAKVLRADGDYDGAARHLGLVLQQYPRDRVARNDLGRIRFLQRRFANAVVELKKVLEVDPEDLQAHYNLMLCYQGMGQPEMAEKERRLYLRFKADEAAQAITGPYRRIHPEDNNERQAIHEHVSVPLTSAGAQTRHSAGPHVDARPGTD